MLTVIVLVTNIKISCFGIKACFMIRFCMRRMMVTDWINHNFGVGLWPLKNDYEADPDGRSETAICED